MAQKILGVPKELKNAVIEIAEMILNDELGGTPIRSEKYGDTSVTYAVPHTEGGDLNAIRRSLSIYGSWSSTSGRMFRS